jgi:hypothetical protein
MAEQGPRGSNPPGFFMVMLSSRAIVCSVWMSFAAVTAIAAEPVAKAPVANPLVAGPAITTGQVGVVEPGYLFSTKEPFVPRDIDYSIELGAMSERHSLYWVAGDIGRHVGRCFLTESQSCQQYLDAIVGVAGRESETYGVFLGSVRWQFVNFPRSWSPFTRVFAGPIHAHTEFSNEWRLASGIGIGLISYLHERVDVRFESRFGYADHAIGQALFSVQVKSDRLLEYFARRLAEVGLMTVETAIKATGAAVQATGEGIGTALEGVTSPFRSGPPTKETPTPAAAPTPAPTPAPLPTSAPK